MGSAFHQLCPRYSGTLTPTAPTAIRLWDTFTFLGKKNNQSLVSDADQEIPTLGSMNNAGNFVKLVSGIISLPSGYDFSVCVGD